MPRYGPLVPVFRPDTMRGAVRVGTTPGAPPNTNAVAAGVWGSWTASASADVLAPRIIGTDWQSTGAGTSGFGPDIPADVVDGDVLLICVRHDDTIVLPTGFNVEEVFTYLGANRISVITGVFNTATHGTPGVDDINFNYSGGTGVTRANWWWLRHASSNPGGFTTKSTNGTNSTYASVTAPGGQAMLFLFGFEDFDNLDTLNGYTIDHNADNVHAFHQHVTTAGAFTGIQIDETSNMENVGFYLAAA